ncbi:LuxR C-terminal-related transcriptional regulator [Streptomyces griseus]|uniref:helix-turn-helix transcriptional regulator n=1 Tax=Streptomyces griseus TaxID=1911 RepID=UPI00386B0088|nr:LuxR C-terminal-related transcriptional regulator [Streptomyces griseus]WTD70000.1 LuxR C-terminal-related transcriptional regulator [Streptomyces griseus]
MIHTKPLTLWALRQILSMRADLEVSTALASIPQRPPYALDLLVLDINAGPDQARVALLATLSARTRVLVMAPAERHREWESPGPPVGFLDDRSTPRQVLAAVCGEVAAQDVGPTLSAREQQVLDCIAEGLTQDQAARRLGISSHTVDTYTRRVRRKLGLGNKADLTRAALVGVSAPVC